MSDFSDSAVFPPFAELPPAGGSSIGTDGSTISTSTSTNATSTTKAGSGGWFLLAQIKEDMTITKPTLIVTDSAGVDFAVTFEDAALNLRGDLGARKGYTLVVPGARRTNREGKKAVVRVEVGRGGQVRVIPGSLEQVLELGRVVGSETVGKQCAACGKTDGPLMRCKGCSTASYCSKVNGWSELGHKSNCKVLKSIREIWA
ncbi:hypothetical protein DL764_001021 [Monosporascus ibericus]|uniref:MYND-type domain-containing protein n=1 Tax=Monosporascus ibericus TaxID=155417 RepID=A0A4Q4TUQ4_9PEZI|nr:hypothetical protein DL764_001021 [Monosporascus ibericus]